MLLYADGVQITKLFNLEGWKKSQNKVYEEDIWAVSLCVGKSLWSHISARLFLLRLEPRCDNDLHGQGTSHNLKENNSFPSFPNRGENTACKIRELNICFDAELFCFAWNCNRSLSSVLIKLWQSGKSHFPVPWEELFYTSHPISD